MKINKKNILFIIPAYNEADVIGSVIKPIVNKGYNVLVIDDCSTDNTSRLAAKAGAITIKHPINLGQGAALQTGIEFAINNSVKLIVTFDADGQHRLNDAEKMIKEILKNGFDIILGSRFLGADALNMPLSKKYLLKIAVFFSNYYSGVKLTDTHNGLRVFTINVAKKIEITQNGMSHASEFIKKIKGFKIKEVPVQIIYSNYSISKGQKLSNSFNILKDLFLGELK